MVKRLVLKTSRSGNWRGGSSSSVGALTCYLPSRGVSVFTKNSNWRLDMASKICYNISIKGGISMGYIYSITNKINNKKYIGKTEYDNPIKRWQEHLRDSERFDRLLYRAIKKYGKENFIFEILFSDLYGEELCQKEIETIKEYNTYLSGYNATLGGDGTSYILEEEKHEIMIDYNKGMSTYKIAQKYNHDRSTISRILKNAVLTQIKTIVIIVLKIIVVLKCIMRKKNYYLILVKNVLIIYLKI